MHAVRPLCQIGLFDCHESFPPSRLYKVGAVFSSFFLACIYLKVKTKDSVKYLFSDQNQILLQQIIFVMEGILLVPGPAELGV